jgi:hypothetical protein
MTEPDVASSDATNIATRIERDGDDYVINGHKWWISGAGDPRCKIFIVMGKTDPNAARHQQQSMILVPADTPGITIKRPLPVFGYDDAPHGHCEILFENVRVPASNMLLGEGRGFEIAQGRLGPGRIHHCMRAIGVAERALELMCKRLDSRVAFGRKISEQGVWRERIAESRIRIDTARLLTLKDRVADGHGRQQAGAGRDRDDQGAGAERGAAGAGLGDPGARRGGVSDDFPLAYQWAGNRTLRLADGPDEVHRNAIAKLELAKLVGRDPGRPHHAPVGLRGRGLDLLRHIAQREGVAGAHRLQPAHAIQAGRTHARFLAAHPVQHHAHHHRAGMPAAGDHAAVDRFGRRFLVDVEGLRVELGGEGDDLVFAHGALAEFDFLARHEIVEIPLLVAHAASPSLKPGCAMKRARWWSASPSVSSIVARRLK